MCDGAALHGPALAGNPSALAEYTCYIKGQHGVGGRVACVVVPPCKGLRSLATLARSRSKHFI